MQGAPSDDQSASGLAPVAPADPRRVGQTALCLSGGGYRAMLFHVGVLWRLNELGQLPKLDRISSVSGGSITAGVLGLNWGQLDFDAGGVGRAFESRVVKPVRSLAAHTIDVPAAVGGLLSRRASASDKVAAAYRKHVFHPLVTGGQPPTLQDLPDRPRFVLNATNVQTGSLWRFSKPYMADYQVGMITRPTVELAVAVAASSAFPPVLSPLQLTVDPQSFAADGRGALYQAPYNTNVVLTDGGVYDNLGLETVKGFGTVLVSDGGARMPPQPKPARDWVRHLTRVDAVIDNQVRSLRKRELIGRFEDGDLRGAYWGMRTAIAEYEPVASLLPCPPDQTLALAQTKTRLRGLNSARQEELINWGYAICDAAMRRWVLAGGDLPPPRFPYPARGVGPKRR